MRSLVRPFFLWITYSKGLSQESITIRSSGCPNGCSRPYVAEIAIVGRAPGIYNLYLGAGHAGLVLLFYLTFATGERLNKLFKEAVNEQQILEALYPIFKDFSKTKEANEHFGDFCVRKGYVNPTTAGPDFHENIKI